MAKPAITKRSVKGAALTYDELDANFQNLADASLSLTAGTGGTQVTADLNGNITLVAGTNVTLTGDNTAKTITVSVTGGTGSGTVNTGSAGKFAYYPSNGNTVDDTLVLSTDGTSVILGGNLNLNGKNISSGGIGNCRIDDDLYFVTANTGPVGNGSLLMRNLASANTSITLGTTDIYLNGSLRVSSTTGTPTNTTTIVGWLKVVVQGGSPITYYLPLYQ